MSARHVGRRAALGGAAMLILAAAEAGIAKAEELDGELLSACRKYHHFHAQEAPFNVEIDACPVGEQHDALWSQLEALWDRQIDLVAIITETPARTPEGIAAKARLMETMFNKNVRVFIGDTFEGCANDRECLAMSLARDILGRAQA